MGIWKRLFCIAIVLSLTAGLICPIQPAAAAGILPDADTFIRNGNPNEFGGLTYLMVNNTGASGSMRMSYLRFPVQLPENRVLTRAVIRLTLKKTAEGTAEHQLALAQSYLPSSYNGEDVLWGEGTCTEKDGVLSAFAPDTGLNSAVRPALLENFEPIYFDAPLVNQSVEVDVTALLAQYLDQDESYVTLRLFGGEGVNTEWYSRESGTGTAPQLVLETAEDPNYTKLEQVIQTVSRDLGDLEAVTGNLPFPVEIDGVQIDWKSGDEACISKTGTVIRPAQYDPLYKEVCVTALFQYRGITREKVYTARVVKDASDFYIAHQIAEEMEPAGLSAVSGDIPLPAEGPVLSHIVWKSGCPDVMTDQGKVYRPGQKDADAEFYLMIQVFYGTASAEKYFPVRVLKLDYEPAPSRVLLHGKQRIAIQKNQAETNYFAEVFDQYDRPMRKEAEFYLENSPEGAEITPSGCLTYDSRLDAGSVIRVCAKADSAAAVLCVVAFITPASAQHPYLLYSEKELEAIRTRAEREPFLTKANAAKREAEKYTAEEAAHAEGIDPWRQMSFSVKAPAGTKSMECQIQMNGEGTAWLDTVSVLEVGVAAVNTPYGGFETEAGWSFSKENEETEFQRQNAFEAERNPQKGAFCARISNASEKSSGRLSMEPLHVKAGSTYVISVYVSIDEVLSGAASGVFIRAVFKDEAGEILQTDLSEGMNRKTPTKRTAVLGTGENAAIAYMLTGQLQYAGIAYSFLRYSLEDMKWGGTYFRDTKDNLDDTYQAVHLGRDLARCAIIYDQIAAAGVMGEQEQNEIRDLFFQVCDILMDRSYYNPYENFSQDNNGTNNKRMKSNYNTFRCIGLSFAAYVFPEYHRAEEVLLESRVHLDWQFKYFAAEDGAWPESLRYQGGIMEQITPYAAVLRRLNGIDMFEADAIASPEEYRRIQDQAGISLIPAGRENEKLHLKNMYQNWMRVLMPRDFVRTGADRGTAGTPAIGDARWRETPYVLGMAASFYTESDPHFSAQLMYSWDSSGQKLGGFYAVSSFLFYQPELPREKPELKSELFTNMGYVIFRQKYDTEMEDYMILSGSPELISHSHPDRTGFSLYADQTPLTLDPGVDGYYDGSSVWHRSTAAHNVVQPRNAAGLLEELPMAAQVEQFETSPELDYASIQAGDTAGAGVRRTVAFVKNGWDFYIVWDAMNASNGGRYHLHTLSTGIEQQDAQLTAHCHQGMDLDISFLEPSAPKIQIGVSALSPGYPKLNGQEVQQHIMADSKEGRDFVTLLYPRKVMEEGMSYMPYSAGHDMVDCYRVEKDGKYLYLLINKQEEESQVSLEIGDGMVELGTGLAYEEENGMTSVTIQPRAISIFRPASQTTGPESAAFCLVPDADTFIKAKSEDEFGGYSYFMVNHKTSGINRKAFLRFRLPVNSADSVKKAVLSLTLKKNESEVRHTINVAESQMKNGKGETVLWGEGTASSGSHPSAEPPETGINWSCAPEVYMEMPEAEFDPPDINQQVQVDVTKLVQAALDAGQKNYITFCVFGDKEANSEWYSRENGNPAYVPMLYLTQEPSQEAGFPLEFQQVSADQAEGRTAVTLFNRASKTLEGVQIYAAYYEGEVLQTLEQATASEILGEQKLELELNCPAEFTSFKLFAWDMDGLAPLAECYERLEEGIKW